MPLFRPEISALTPYKVGRQLEEVARSHGLRPDDIVKLTANEGPDGPFPGVVAAVTETLESSNRYPDNDCWLVGQDLAKELQVDFENILFGAGSVALVAEMTRAVGGSGTNLVYGWPSFIMYRFAAIWAGSNHVEVPLRGDHSLDLDGMAEAIDESTRAVIVCNPNNPTGTIRAAGDIEHFIESVRDDVLVIVDEAYHEFVTDERYATMIPKALERPNVVVLRTFSKIYSLAAYRIGYAVGQPETLAEVRKVQPPLTVSSVAQAAARASLGQPDELEQRRQANAARRHHVVGALAERGLDSAESHTNFVYFRAGDGANHFVDEMMARGVLVRGMQDGWVRVTLGDERENERFIAALDEALLET